MPPPTTPDRRPGLWDVRHHEVTRLGNLRAARRRVCGCVRCKDGDRGTELDALIARSLESIARYTNKICERSRFPC